MALAFAALGSGRITDTGKPVSELSRWFELLLMAGVYWRGYLVMRVAGPRALPTVVIFGGIFALLGLVLPRFDSRDLYLYVNIGWMQHHYGLNPYTRLISAAPGWQHDPMFAKAWVKMPSLYGSLFTLYTRLVVAIGGGHLLRTIMLFKLTAVAAYAAVAILIRVIGIRVGLARVDLALFLYLWSPEILIHELEHAHNDMFAAAFVMLAIWFAATDLPFLILPMIVAAVLIKPFAEGILPFAFFYMVRRRGLFPALYSAAAAAGLFVVCTLPFRWDWTPLPWQMFVGTLFSPNYSLASSAYYVVDAVNRLAPLGAAYRWVTHGVIAAYLLAGAILLAAGVVRFAENPRPSIQNFAQGALLAQLIAILIALSDFYPWHQSTLLPAALVLAPGNWLRQLAIALSLTWLLYFTKIGDLIILNALIMTAVPMVWIGLAKWTDVKSTFFDAAWLNARREPVVSQGTDRG